MADGDDGAPRSQPSDLGGGVAEVLALQPRQPVDLQREDERAEAEGGPEAEAEPARAADREAGAEEDRQRREGGQQVAAVEVVAAEQRQQQRQGHGAEADRGGEAGAAALPRIAAGQQQRQRRRGQPQRHPERDRPARPHAVLAAVVVADQLRRRPPDPRPERFAGDPAGVGVALLAQHDRQQQGGDDGDRRQPQCQLDLLGAGAAAEQQRRLGDHDEGGEIVGGDGERGECGPAGEVAAAPAPPQAGEEEEGEGGEEEDQGVGAGVLGEPDENRADGDDRRRQQAGAAPQRQRQRGQVDDHDRGRAGEGRERAQPELAGPERPRPEPGERVVQRRRRLAPRHRGHRVEEARVQHPGHRHRLVVAVALQVDRAEAEGGAESDDRAEGDEVRRGGEAAARHGAMLSPLPKGRLGAPPAQGDGASPPCGGGGSSGAPGAKLGKRPEWRRALSTPRLAE